jgi:integrase
LNSFMSFRNNRDLLIDNVNSDLMLAYEAHLKEHGSSMNTISFYMRIMRAIYNRAVEKGISKQRYPFRHVYTGVEKTIKRAIPLKQIRTIKDASLTKYSSTDFARDMFMFSFYTRGMSFVDMAYLQKSDLQNGILCYRRRKTGQQMVVRWEPCMQHILEKYQTLSKNYLLPIITDTEGDERLQYLSTMFMVNNRLKRLAQKLKIPAVLTMYVARHSWASVAKSRNIPISVISESMGHNSESTTQIYLASLDTTVVDRANREILKLLWP